MANAMRMQCDGEGEDNTCETGISFFNIFRKFEIGHFAFRTFRRCETGHFAFRSCETGHFAVSHPGHYAARHSLRVSGGASHHRDPGARAERQELMREESGVGRVDDANGALTTEWRFNGESGASLCKWRLNEWIGVGT